MLPARVVPLGGVGEGPRVETGRYYPWAGQGAARVGSGGRGGAVEGCRGLSRGPLV